MDKGSSRSQYHRHIQSLQSQLRRETQTWRTGYWEIVSSYITTTRDKASFGGTTFFDSLHVSSIFLCLVSSSG